MNTTTLPAEEGPTRDGMDQLFLQSKALRVVDRGILITDRHARILWMNPAFSKSTGYRVAEVLGRTPRLFKSGQHDESFYRQFWDTVLSGETWRGQFINRRRDGSLCLHAQTTTPVRRHSTGPITHFISVSEDITDRKNGEDEAREIRDGEAVGQLAAGIAHHFNNMLTVIQGNSETLLRRNGSLDPESKILLERMLATSCRAAHLVRQLVGLSQSQALEFQELDLNSVVEGIFQVFRSTAQRNIEWDRRYLVNLPAVLADRGRLGQVVSHLLANALDAMPQGGRLTLTTERLVMTPADIKSHPAARPAEFVCLTIRDTGCGIPPTNLARIFQPFFTTKETGDRSGLGLALVYGIVKQHHGWTEVSSQIGRGATFKIFLPAIPEPLVLPATAFVAPESPHLAQRTTELWPEPEPGLYGTVIHGASTDRAGSSVSSLQSDPLAPRSSQLYL